LNEALDELELEIDDTETLQGNLSERAIKESSCVTDIQLLATKMTENVFHDEQFHRDESNAESGRAGREAYRIDSPKASVRRMLPAPFRSSATKGIDDTKADACAQVQWSGRANLPSAEEVSLQ
jgi:hypothetical protein